MHALPRVRFHLFKLQTALRNHFGDPSISVSHFSESGRVSMRRKKRLSVEYTFHYLEVKSGKPGKVVPTLAVMDVGDNPGNTNNIVETGKEMFVPAESYKKIAVAPAIKQILERIKHPD